MKNNYCHSAFELSVRGVAIKLTKTEYGSKNVIICIKPRWLCLWGGAQDHGRKDIAQKSQRIGPEVHNYDEVIAYFEPKASEPSIEPDAQERKCILTINMQPLNFSKMGLYGVPWWTETYIRGSSMYMKHKGTKLWHCGYRRCTYGLDLAPKQPEFKLRRRSQQSRLIMSPHWE